MNLLNFDEADLGTLLQSVGEPSYRAKQILHWIHQLGITNFDAMTNLNLNLRRWLLENAEIITPTIITTKISSDGTQKWLCELADKNLIEMVFIPEDDRGTLCISSQAGCPLNCAFCATGKQGFKRNLEVAEIIGQVWLATKTLCERSPNPTEQFEFKQDDKFGASTAYKDINKHCEKCEGQFAQKHLITNVVLMGMGEPLLNFDNVVKAVNLMLDDLTYNLSKYRVTISTVGIVPKILQLRKATEAALTISLHAPNDNLRSQLIPVNKEYPLADLMHACKNYFTDRRRKITFAYIMLHQINDQPNHAKELVKLIKGIDCKVNLIRFNNFSGINFRSATDLAVESFRNILINAGINTQIRKTRGLDIEAACGQLTGNQST